MLESLQYHSAGGNPKWLRYLVRFVAHAVPQVRSIVWSDDDSRLVSCGMDGAVYEWDTLTSKRESECVLKTCMYTSIATSPDAKVIFAVGTDSTLKEIQDHHVR